MGARWYDPALGRWLQADSIVPEPGNPQALNRYTYVYNNPLRYTDPSGHWIFEGGPGDPYFIGPWLYEAQRRQDFITPHDPTTGEFVAVVTAPLWAPTLAVGLEAVALGLWEAGTIAYESVTWWITLKLLKLGALGGGGAKVAADACADGDCTNEVREGTTTLYRFANGPEDLTSRLSRVTDPQLRAELQARIASMSPSELQALADRHAMGLVENSPFISTLLDPAAAANTPDLWLHSIIHGSVNLPAAQYLYQLAVPNNLLYNPTTLLSQLETEVLILAETLEPYVTSVIQNPYIITR
jgi:hypothetical protein